MPPTTAEDALLTCHQAGLVLGISARTVQRKAGAGEIPYAQKLPGPNGAYLLREADVRKYAASLDTLVDGAAWTSLASSSSASSRGSA